MSPFLTVSEIQRFNYWLEIAQFSYISFHTSIHISPLFEDLVRISQKLELGQITRIIWDYQAVTEFQRNI